MTTREDLESFLLRAGLESEEIGEGMWSVPVSEDGKRMIIHYSPPHLILRVRVMPVPEEGSGAALLRRLLELNASDLVRGAYGIDGDEIILSDALEMERLDFAQFQDALDAVQVAVASHREPLARFVRSETQTS
ncbi:MAG: CesT family type III secretion system chaperone [Longimicrobiaceae bacterium]